MNFKPPLMVVAVALSGSIVAASLTHAADDQMPKDRAGLDAYIRAYILNNPKVVRDALLKLDQEEQAQNTKNVLSGYKDDLYRAGSPEVGAADAKIRIVEFFDYNCPYCRASYPKVKAFLKANPDAALVLKDVASFGPDSEAAGRIALAAKLQGKFEALHDALITSKGKATQARALELAAKLGLDVAKLKQDAQSAAVGDLFARTRDLANRLNANVTPLFIIGHNGISGAPDDLEAQLSEYVGEVRKSGCDVC